MSCQVCFTVPDDGRFGSITDLNGHKWRVCKACIDSLWRDRHAMNTQDERLESDIANAVIALAELITERIGR